MHEARLVITLGGGDPRSSLLSISLVIVLCIGTNPGYPKDLAPSSQAFCDICAAHADVYTGAAEHMQQTRSLVKK